MVVGLVLASLAARERDETALVHCPVFTRGRRVDLWGRMAELMLQLVDEYDDLTIFLWLFIEETGFPLPLPGDLAILLAGYRVSQGMMNPL